MRNIYIKPRSVQLCVSNLKYIHNFDKAHAFIKLEFIRQVDLFKAYKQDKKMKMAALPAVQHHP